MAARDALDAQKIALAKVFDPRGPARISTLRKQNRTLFRTG